MLLSSTTDIVNQIIAPGSSITQTQLGLPETFTPPRWRFPTRMFPGLNDGEWEPVFVREKVKLKVQPNGDAATTANGASKDVEMGDNTVPAPAETNGTTDEQESKMESLPSDSTGAVQPAEPQPDTTIAEDQEEETEFYDDPFTAANAVYPLKNGRIENWPCFFALLSHIYQMISPPFLYMPVMVISQPCWTARDKETITQYFFENWKIPALCVMDSALAAAWGFGVPSACVVDVGLDKCDVTAITEYVVNEIGRGVAIEGCGGSALTQRLKEEFAKQGDKYKDIEDLGELAEQVKRSPVCEILPMGTPLPGKTAETVSQPAPNPLIAASTGLEGSTIATQPIVAPAVQNGTNGQDEQEEDMLDVAAIVAQNNAAELIAKREREKAEREAKKKGGAPEPPKQVRLRNAEKYSTAFTFEDFPASEQDNLNRQSRKRKRDIEIGPERFMLAGPSKGSADSVVDRIASAVHSTIMNVPDITSRSTLWDNLIIVGNGSKVRGFPNALLEVLSARYTLSPSNATIFTSELPSNFSTPVPTGGTNTPIPGQHHHQLHHVGSGVNPLLVAATKNMHQHLQVPPGHMQQQHHQHGGYTPQHQMMDQQQHHSYRGITQSPTSLKVVKAPEYFPEWKDPSVAGMEEAGFLGAQVAAKVVFIVDQGISKGFLTRSEYNELGPEGIHSCAM